ncbi:hypothetical protein GCM10009113_30460 [Marinobacter szutsaonensis]
MPANAAPPPPISADQWWRLLRLSLFAFMMGFVSAAYWIFAPDLVVNLGAMPSDATGWLWLGVGAAGLGGAVVADLADRNNPPVTQALMLMMLAASLALLAASQSKRRKKMPACRPHTTISFRTRKANHTRRSPVKRRVTRVDSRNRYSGGVSVGAAQLV